MEPNDFIRKWRDSTLRESQGSKEHFLDLCELLDEAKPAEADPHGNSYCFERGAKKDSGGDGWADVWKRHCFAWEYKGKRKNLEAAFNQLRQYVLSLENPPLLIVSDMERIIIRTNWTNTVSEVHEFRLDDLADAATRDRLKWAFSNPERLRPGQTRQALTEQAAQSFAELAEALRARGHDPLEVAHFVNRLVFCMFAEDVGLLPDQLFTKLLQAAKAQPAQFEKFAGDLFGAMQTGGYVNFQQVEWFNGGLFDDDSALGLEKVEIGAVLEAARLDWSQIDPSILGTLFERGLDPEKRAQLGAHYTDRDKIMLIVEPVVIRPWLHEWERERAGMEADLKRRGGRRKAHTRWREFLARLRSFTVLDPACGSGNFLYLALQALKNLERQVIVEGAGLGFPQVFPEIGPQNVKGIEINPYAAELARVSVWIGEIQWMRANGFSERRDPILRPLDTIECRDAILTEDGKEPDWPDADVIIGNPPFLGYSPQRDRLGEAYTEDMRRVYKGKVPAFADLVCYWFQKAGRLVADKQVARAGLVATNSIRGGKNRAVLDRICQEAAIFHARADEPWTVDGAAVRVSLICFGRRGAERRLVLDGNRVQQINADLTASNADLTGARRLSQNGDAAFVGNQKTGPFDVPGDVARWWLTLPMNPNGRPNSDVLKPWMNGMDVTRRPSGRWLVDFGTVMTERDAALFQAPFDHVETHVKPRRQKYKGKKLGVFWFRHENYRPQMWTALDRMSKCIATPRVAKHRLFVWLDVRVCPDCQLVVIARDDDTTFGVLHSRFHELWSLRLGTSLEDRPRYTPTTTFQTFPFPEGLTPDIPAANYAADPRAMAIADAARALVDKRDRWLNPPEWIRWVDEPVPGYPKRPEPVDAAAARAVKARTLTNLYNERPQWLQDAHADLDAAVAAAYGWPKNISDDDALAKLLALNAGRE